MCLDCALAATAVDCLWHAGSVQAKQGRQPTVATWPTAAASFAAASANGLSPPAANQVSPIRHPLVAFPAKPASPVSACLLGPSESPASPVKPIGPVSPPSQALPIGLPIKTPRPSPVLTAGATAVALDQKAVAASAPSQTALPSGLAPSSFYRSLAGSSKAPTMHASSMLAPEGLAAALATSTAVTSGSNQGVAPNKRRKLGTLTPPPGLLLGSRAKQVSQASLLSRQNRLSTSDVKADSENSDAQSHHDVQGPEASTPISTDHQAPVSRVSAAPIAGETAADQQFQGQECYRGSAASVAHEGQDMDRAIAPVASPHVLLQTNSTGITS